MPELDLLFILKNNAAYLLDRGFPKASQACTDAVTEIEKLRGALQDVYGEMAESGADFTEGTPANVAAALSLQPVT